MAIELSIDMDQLIFCLQNQDALQESYLDLETGNIVALDDALSNDDETPDLTDERRFLPIVPIPSGMAYQMMQDFITTIEDMSLKKILSDSLNRKRPFRAFKDALLPFPELEDEWYNFEEDLLKLHALDWLKQNQVSLMDDKSGL